MIIVFLRNNNSSRFDWKNPKYFPLSDAYPSFLRYNLEQRECGQKEESVDSSSTLSSLLFGGSMYRDNDSFILDIHHDMDITVDGKVFKTERI